jgi:hypothetical protein
LGSFVATTSLALFLNVDSIDSNEREFRRQFSS